MALALGALFIGLAPLVHALCVAPVSSSATMSHIMADGSTMTMGDQPGASSGTGSPDVSASAQVTVNPAATVLAILSETQPSTTFGSILVAVGLAILTIFGLQRCARAMARFDVRSRSSPPLEDRWPDRLPPLPYAVSLDSLGISRT